MGRRHRGRGGRIKGGGGGERDADGVHLGRGEGKVGDASIAGAASVRRRTARRSLPPSANSKDAYLLGVDVGL